MDHKMTNFRPRIKTPAKNWVKRNPPNHITAAIGMNDDNIIIEF